MVVGLTGPNASGKGEAALYLKSKGFQYYSLSDILREESKERKIRATRENLIRLGNELRREEGPSILAARIAQKLSKKNNYIIDSIRNPAEIGELRRLGDFILIGIDAPVEIRFKRSQKRKRFGDARSLREFIEKEASENKKDPENQQLRKCLKMADAIVINDATLKEFQIKIDEAFKKIRKA